MQSFEAQVLPIFFVFPVKVKKKPTNPVDKYVEKYNQLPQEKLKSILKSSTKLKNHGVVVRQCHGGEKIQNKMREIDRLLKVG